MTDQSADLVTKIDVEPDLAGLTSFEAGIDRAIKKVNQLGEAIRRVNNLAPKSRFSSTGGAGGAGGMPSAATVAAVSAISASGVNLVSRLPVGKVVAQEAAKIQRAVAASASPGIAGLLSPPGGFGGFLPPPGAGGASGAFGGGGGALARLKDAFTPDTSAGSFSGTPIDPKNRRPIPAAVQDATGRNSFGVDAMLGGAALTAGAVAAWNSISQSLDNITKQQNQLARLPQTVDSAADSFFRLNAAATETKTDASAFISTYANIATATEKLGLSEKEAIEATQGLTSALALGGGSEQAVSAALYQMGQAFSSNRFGGDEFRSFMEAIGTMAPEVAKAFDTDIKGLREMSEAGQLTAEKVTAAFRKMATNNIALLKKQGWTWGQVMTVMTNDWNAFLAKATIGGEWKRLADFFANELLPIIRGVENTVADFWSSLTDESKAAFLIGILGAVGAALAALAVPALTAMAPFILIGGAIWLLYQTFIEFKAWLDGNGGTIFDELFGSFDEFERRYPKLVAGLQTIVDLIQTAWNGLNSLTKDENGNGLLDNPTGIAWSAIKRATPVGAAMDVAKGALDIFGGGEGAAGAATGAPAPKGNTTISNSGNRTVTIQVATPQQAGQVVNSLDNIGTITEMAAGNIAEATGAR